MKKTPTKKTSLLFLLYLLLLQVDLPALKLSNFGYTSSIALQGSSTTLIIPKLPLEIDLQPAMTLNFEGNTPSNKISIFLDQNLIFEGPPAKELTLFIPKLLRNVSKSVYTLTICHDLTKPLFLSQQSTIAFWNEENLWTKDEELSLKDHFYKGALQTLKLDIPKNLKLSDKGKEVIQNIINFLKMSKAVSYPQIKLTKGTHYWIQPFIPSHYTTHGCGFSAYLESKNCIDLKLFVNGNRAFRSQLYPHKPSLIHSKENIYSSVNELSIELKAPSSCSIQLTNLDTSSFNQKLGYSIENYLQHFSDATIFISTSNQDIYKPEQIGEWIGKRLYIPNKIHLLQNSKLASDEWLISTSKNHTDYLINRLSQRKKMFSRKYPDANKHSLIDLMSYPKGLGLFGRTIHLDPLPDPSPSNGIVLDLIYRNGCWQDLYIWTESTKRKKFIKKQSFFWKNSRFYVIVILITMITSILLFFKKNLNQGQP